MRLCLFQIVSWGWPLLLTWINLNPWIIKLNYSSIRKLQWLHNRSLWMDKLFHPTLYNECSCLSILGFKLNHVSIRGPLQIHVFHLPICFKIVSLAPGSAFIKPNQRNPWIKDQLGKALLSTNLHLQLPNFVSCGRDKPSHMTQNLVTVGANLQAGEWFLFDPWSTDQADLVW